MTGITPPGGWMEGSYMYAVVYKGELWVAPFGTPLPVHDQPIPPTWLKFPAASFGFWHEIKDGPQDPTDDTEVIETDTGQRLVYRDGAWHPSDGPDI